MGYANGILGKKVRGFQTGYSQFGCAFRRKQKKRKIILSPVANTAERIIVSGIKGDRQGNRSSELQSVLPFFSLKYWNKKGNSHEC